MIYDISVSQPPAVYDKTTMNVGSMENNGFEIEPDGRTRSHEGLELHDLAADLAQ